MKNSIFLFLSALLLLSACGNKATKKQSDDSAGALVTDSALLIQPEFAKGFTVKYIEDGVRLVDISDPQKGEDDEGAMETHKKHGQETAGRGEKMQKSYHFALIPRGTKPANIPDGYVAVEVPIRRTICMTTPQLSNFIVMNALDFVKGITSTKNLYNQDVKQRVKDGRIVKIGMEGNFDSEVIIAANPDVIFISPFKRGGYEAIKETGITLVPHLGYKELDPLGQAEWMKFIGIFTGMEKEANETFRGIKERYNEVKALAQKATTRPTVMSGEMHNGNWFAVGGKNYLAQMFRDAGAEYILKDDTHTGGIPMEYEKIYSLAANADYWRILNSFPGEFSYEALKASDPRNADFKAWKERHVLYCNMKKTAYYEAATVQPDVLLKDFLFAFHPELMPADYQPTYYQMLK